jgi:predicted outer membrane repeat protein
MLPSTYYAATASDLIADINAANKGSATSTIILTAPTTSRYLLTAVDNTSNGANGLPVIKKGLTIVGNGDTIERSSGPAFRLFDVAAGASLTLKNVTLQGGWVFGSGASAEGGAIYSTGTLVLDGATVQNNTAQASNGADAKSVKQNGGTGQNAAGGGIWSSGSLTLENGTLVECH